MNFSISRRRAIARGGRRPSGRGIRRCSSYWFRPVFLTAAAHIEDRSGDIGR
ncbi:hypothetical protein RHECNPAF_750069 [Rhizobium etli CNPAF512]|nr:hypothetical protein RHECNPAF_750069 [Rhizobium etli CNPAF512]